MLTLQVLYKLDRIHAHGGGLLVTVYPGGTFMGFEFDELASMGTGEHAVEVRNPVDFQNTGLRPVPVSVREAELARFEEVLFGYQVGAYTSLEVLAIAERTINAIALRR